MPMARVLNLSLAEQFPERRHPMPQQPLVIPSRRRYIISTWVNPVVTAPFHWLIWAPPNDTLADNSPLNLFFFDQASQSATPLFLEETTEAPEYAFVSGLGSYDYYARRGTITEETPPLLGDMMWVYDRCQ